MADAMFPEAKPELSQAMRDAAPENQEAFEQLNARVYADGALSEKTKALIAVAVAHVTQCPYCIKSHTAQALKAEASNEEVMEAVWVAAAVRAGSTMAHGLLAADLMQQRE
jgi:AhpD family alkylhydroperoxidase